jgi:hypothetical protein
MAMRLQRDPCLLLGFMEQLGGDGSREIRFEYPFQHIMRRSGTALFQKGQEQPVEPGGRLRLFRRPG